VTAATIRLKVAFRTCRRRQPERRPAPRPVGPTAIARRVALAHHIESLIAAGDLCGYADAARRLGLTRARLTQVCDLTLLAPDIQAVVLLGLVEPRDRHLREVGRHLLWNDQRQAFHHLFPNVLEDDNDRD
jgi:hypothetical protein